MAENSTGGYHSDGCIQFLKFDLNETYFVKLHTIRPLTTVVSTYFLMLYPHRDYWTGALGQL